MYPSLTEATLSLEQRYAMVLTVIPLDSILGENAEHCRAVARGLFAEAGIGAIQKLKGLVRSDCSDGPDRLALLE